jgi:hypothetical protein
MAVVIILLDIAAVSTFAFLTRIRPGHAAREAINDQPRTA